MLRGPVHPQLLLLRTRVPQTKVLIAKTIPLIAPVPSLGLHLPLAKTWRMVLWYLQGMGTATRREAGQHQHQRLFPLSAFNVHPLYSAPSPPPNKSSAHHTEMEAASPLLSLHVGPGWQISFLCVTARAYFTPKRRDTGAGFFSLTLKWMILWVYLFKVIFNIHCPSK